MTDQAADLRALAGPDSAGTGDTAKVIAVASGKGGVGKSTLVANLGIYFARRGMRSLVLDGDMGLANLDVLMNLDPSYSIQHVISGHKSLDDIIVEGPFGLRLIPGASGLLGVADMDPHDRTQVLAQLAKMGADADVVLIDTPAGIGSDVISLAAAAQEVLVVATPEPTSIRDAYALIKVLWQHSGISSFRLLVNRAPNRQITEAASEQISAVAQRFLNLDIGDLGYLPDDSNVSSAIRKQEALLISYPRSPVAKGIEILAERLLNDDRPLDGRNGILEFVQRIVRRRERAIAV